MSKLYVDEILGHADPDVVKIPTGNPGEYVQDLFTGVGDATLKPADIQISNLWVDARRYGTAGLWTTVSAAIAAIGSDPRVLYLAPGDWEFGVDYAIPQNITLKPEGGAVLVIDDNVTLSINGHIDAGRRKIFSFNGPDAAVGGLSLAHAEWFGVSEDETAANNLSFMQKAVNSASVGGLVALTLPGTYSCSGTVYIHKSNTQLCLGAGVIWDAFGLDDDAFLIVNSSTGTRVNSGVAELSANTTVMDKTIQLDRSGTTAGFAVGQHVFIYRSDSNQTSKVSWSIVQAISGDILTVYPPIQHAWDTSIADPIDVISIEPIENVRIFGGGQIKNSTAAASSVLIRAEHYYNLIIEDIKLYITSNAAAPRGKCISLGNELVAFGANADVSKVKCECPAVYGPSRGIETGKVTFGSKIHECSAEQSDIGILVQGSHHKIFNNDIWNSSTEAIRLKNCSDVHCTNNSLMTDGIGVSYDGNGIPDSYNITISRNECKGGTNGIKAQTGSEGFSGIIITENNVVDATTPYYVVGPSVTGFSSIKFANNSPSVAYSEPSDASIVNTLDNVYAYETLHEMTIPGGTFVEGSSWLWEAIIRANDPPWYYAKYFKIEVIIGSTTWNMTPGPYWDDTWGGGSNYNYIYGSTGGYNYPPSWYETNMSDTGTGPFYQAGNLYLRWHQKSSTTITPINTARLTTWAYKQDVGADWSDGGNRPFIREVTCDPTADVSIRLSGMVVAHPSYPNESLHLHSISVIPEVR